jgi:tetratricopeptide (TPR) repeat protein
VYALGVVLYEMLAGRLPFPRDAHWTTRLNGLPEPPSRSPRAPDGRWDAIVLRCLQPEPARRFRSAADVLGAIDRAFGTLRRRRLIAAAAILLAAGGPVAVFRERIWPQPLARLAIVPFTGSSADRAIDERARGALYDVARQLESLGAASQRMVVIPFEESLRNDVRSAADAASRLGATHVLTGALAPSGSGFGLRAAITDSRTGTILRDFSGEYRQSDLAGLPTSLAGVVTSAFRLEKPPASGVNAAAYPEYAAGLAAVRAAPPDLDRAIGAFEQALRADSGSATLHGCLADAYQRKFVVTRDPAWLAAAKSSALRAQSLQPDSPAVLLVLGAIEDTEGRPERAIELFQRAAALEPGNSEGYRRTGLALQRIGRDAEAIASLRRAAQLAPEYYSPHHSLGFVLFRAGRYAEAVEEFRTGTRLAPASPDGLSALGALLLALERDAEAEETLRKAIAVREARAPLNNLGILLVYRRRDAEAVDVFRRALRAGADDAGLRLNLALALHRTGRREEAHEQFDRASSLVRASLLRDPRDAVSRARLSYAQLRLGHKDIAVDDALQAARLAPSDYSVLFWCVMTLEAAGRRAEALAMLAASPTERLRDFRRQPDLADFARDPRFQALLESSQPNDERTKRK